MKKAKSEILIIDDDVKVSGMLSEHFTKKGFVARVAHSGEEGLTALKEKRPDLIILDVMMPKMDGFQFLKYIKTKKSYSAIPVIMLTVKSDAESLNKGLDLKADFYLPKPYSLKEIMKFANLTLGTL